MRTFSLLALAGSTLLSACSDPPTYLEQPANPRIAVRAPRYTTVTAGVKRFDVVDPKDWRELNRAVTPKPGQGGMEGMPGMGGKGGMEGMPGMKAKPGQGGMEGMPGMGGKASKGDMKGMPGMGKPQGGGGQDDSNMPGMNMPGMGGKRDTGGR